MINTTRWRLDTCDCVFEYTWDTEVPQDERVHSFKRAVNVCAAHQDFVSSEAAIYDKAKGENNLKNRVYGIIEKDHAELKDVFEWEFDANRKLKVTLAGAQKSKKDAIAAKIDAQEGQGKVTII